MLSAGCWVLIVGVRVGEVIVGVSVVVLDRLVDLDLKLMDHLQARVGEGGYT